MNHLKASTAIVLFSVQTNMPEQLSAAAGSVVASYCSSTGLSSILTLGYCLCEASYGLTMSAGVPSNLPKNMLVCVLATVALGVNVFIFAWKGLGATYGLIILGTGSLKCSKVIEHFHSIPIKLMIKIERAV